MFFLYFRYIRISIRNILWKLNESLHLIIPYLHSLHSDTATGKQRTADNTAFQQIHSNSTRPDYLGFAGLLKWLLEVEVLKSTSSQIPQFQVTKTGAIIAPIKLQHSRWQFSANASTHDNHTNMFPGAGLSPLSPPPSSKTSKLSWCCGVAAECWQCQVELATKVRSRRFHNHGEGPY